MDYSTSAERPDAPIALRGDPSEALSGPANTISGDDCQCIHCALSRIHRAARRQEHLEACCPELDSGYPTVDPGDLDAFERERANWTFRDIVDREA